MSRNPIVAEVGRDRGETEGSAPSPVLIGALDAAGRGMKVFPVHGIERPGPTEAEARCTCGASCDSPGKHPVRRGWQELATADHVVINEWFGNGQRHNFGIVLGHGWTVVEVDPYQGGRLKTLRARVGELGPISASGRGFHVFYRGGSVANGTSLGPGITVRATGYFVVGPGSTHWNGRRYGRRRYGWEQMHERPELALASAGAEFDWKRERRERVKLTAEPIPQGERNLKMASIVGKLVQALPQDEALAVAIAYDLAHCRPPLGGDRISRMVEDFVAKDRAARAPALRSVSGTETTLDDVHEQAPGQVPLDLAGAIGEAADEDAVFEILTTNDPPKLERLHRERLRDKLVKAAKGKLQSPAKVIEAWL
jgi:hypothetical protein